MVVAGRPLSQLYTVALLTGMRQGEILGLKWQDVDLDAGTLQVRRGLAFLSGGRYVEQEPKSAKSRRLLILAPQAIEALKRHRAQQEETRELFGDEWVDLDFVFANTFGRPLRPHYVGHKRFKALLKRAGLPDMRFHDLRHSTASLLLALGVHPKVVSEQLGHSTITLTLDTYSHALPTLQADAARKLGSLLEVDYESSSRS